MEKYPRMHFTSTSKSNGSRKKEKRKFLLFVFLLNSFQMFPNCDFMFNEAVGLNQTTTNYHVVQTTTLTRTNDHVYT